MIFLVIGGLVLIGVGVYLIAQSKSIGGRLLENERQKLQTELDSKIQEHKKQFELQKELQESALKAEEEKTKLQIKYEIEEWTKSAQEAANEHSQSLIDQNKKACLEERLKLYALQDEIEDFRNRRAALNESIRLEQKLQDTENSHKIQLSEFDIEDIGFLNSISNKLHNREILGKLIWSTYLQKPFNEMINRLFGSNVPRNVVYCIQNVDTQEKYIGKTTSNVKDRWANHIKSSLGIGTLSNQKIHEALKGNWNHFSFSIIEEVDADQKLSDREKFYIEMFESHIYGYNMKV